MKANLSNVNDNKEINKSLSEKSSRGKSRSILREIAILLVSTFFGTFSQTCIMIPAGLTSGGLPGVVRIITHFIPVSYPLVYYLSATTVVVLVFITLGWTDVRKIFAMSISYPVMLYLFERLDFTLVDSEDRFLATILIGVCYGVAAGIGYMGGYSSGGTDSISRIIKFKLLPHIPIGTILMAIDGIVVISSAFVFDPKVAMYALVNVYLCGKVTRTVMLGLSGHFVQFDIISQDPESVTQFILTDIGRAVTSHVSIGEFTKSERKTLTVICTPRESLRIKQYLAEHDPSAFATIMPINTVWGKDNGFSDINEIDNT